MPSPVMLGDALFNYFKQLFGIVDDPLMLHHLGCVQAIDGNGSAEADHVHAGKERAGKCFPLEAVPPRAQSC